MTLGTIHDPVTEVTAPGEELTTYPAQFELFTERLMLPMLIADVIARPKRAMQVISIMINAVVLLVFNGFRFVVICASVRVAYLCIVNRKS